VIETAAFALMLGLAAYLSHKLGGWQMAAPLLAFYVFAAYRLLPQFQQIYVNAMLVQQNARIVDALAELMPTTAGQASAAAGGASGERLEPPIVLDRVTYSYPASDKAVLDEASMEIPARSTVGT
jgi:ABC-type multidrug transport system fused ATPase/permease subunit